MEDNEGQVKEEYEEEPEHNSHISSMSDDEPGMDELQDCLQGMDELQRKMGEIEEEQRKLKQIQSEVEGSFNLSASTTSLSSLTNEEKAESDAKSVYVGNVDYACTAEELEAHFHGCGAVSRVTIQLDKFSGHPKGFAYIEFADMESKKNALAMHESLLRGRQIKVMEKRTNKPGISTTNRFPRMRGGGYRGRSGVVVKYVYPRLPRGMRGIPRRRPFMQF